MQVRVSGAQIEPDGTVEAPYAVTLEPLATPMPLKVQLDATAGVFGVFGVVGVVGVAGVVTGAGVTGVAVVDAPPIVALSAAIWSRSDWMSESLDAVVGVALDSVVVGGGTVALRHAMTARVLGPTYP